MSRLAFNGGKPVRTKPFPPHPIIGDEEKRAVMDVLNSGHISSFIASPGKHFLGGEKVQELERLFADYHKTTYAVVFNSATAALHAAIVATVQPGKEIITTPYTFTSTATCAFMNNAVPVFVDVCPDTFNINPDKIVFSMSPLVEAIIPVHLFGNPANMDRIVPFAKRYGLKVIEDCAQAPGAKYRGKRVGTIGDCGIFSLTESKNIMSGEGGVLITDDSDIADIARLVRNHGEAVMAGRKREYKSQILGYNYRMTELAAAVGIEQFKKLDRINAERNKLANYLTKNIKDIPGLTPPKVDKKDYHAYYGYGILYDKPEMSRDVFLKLLEAEGIPLGGGYIKPLYYQPIFHDNKPFIFQHYKGNASYEKGLCPVAEKLYYDDLILTDIVRPPATFDDMDNIIEGLEKVAKSC